MSQLNLLGMLKWKDVMKLGKDGNGRRNMTSLSAHEQVILSLDLGLILWIPNTSYWTGPSTWQCYKDKHLRSQMSETSLVLQFR